MTNTELRSLCARACEGYVHTDIQATLRIVQLLDGEERKRAIGNYLAIIGEPGVPIRPVKGPVRNVTLRSPARDFLNRQAAARRKLEAMRDGVLQRD